MTDAEQPNPYVPPAQEPSVERPEPSIWDDDGRLPTSTIVALTTAGVFGLTILFCSGFGGLFALSKAPHDAGGAEMLAAFCLMALSGVGVVSLVLALNGYWRRVFLALLIAAICGILGIFAMLWIAEGRL